MGGAKLGRKRYADEPYILKVVRLLVLNESSDVKAAVREIYREHPEIEGASENAIIERIAGKIYEHKDQLLADAKREVAESLEDDEGAILCGMSGTDVERLARHVRSLPQKERSPLVIKVFRVLSEVDHMRAELRRNQRRAGWSSTMNSDLLMAHFFYLYTRVALGEQLYDEVIAGWKAEETD